MDMTVEGGSLKRGVLLLKILASAGMRGLALTEIAARAALPHPSAHRVLRQLVQERLADHDGETRRYRLGPLAFELGVASSMMYDIRDLCEPAMAALAKQTEDTIYLVVRSGFDAVCMHCHEGSFPIKTLVLDVGSRRPLGIGAGGLAILSAVPLEEQAHIIERIAPSLDRYRNLTVEDLAAACAQAREARMAVIRNRLNLGVSAVGLPLRNAAGQPVAALSVAAMSQRVTTRRIPMLADQLRAAVAQAETALRWAGV
ncbi:IclR family transcriptional regulator [Achromobacter aloeverae]|uniref:IclR family transcriptional regulator n=1 Tax=Achromobacter aloeverae TaxID=1750518 RepID=A0A4Q1HHL6_9BURK|nr:IclR family transcriptional regulator [Achromobacter aloeverae]RXN86154.1 IclR family transcriptional regulator [Achromobacter aloeverae]